MKQSVVGSSLREHFEKEVDDKKEQIRIINENLEGEIIMGRPFFDNFDFIQFNHTDREKEESCFFTYKVKKDRIVSRITLDSPDLKEEIAAKRPKKSQ